MNFKYHRSLTFCPKHVDKMLTKYAKGFGVTGGVCVCEECYKEFFTDRQPKQVKLVDGPGNIEGIRRWKKRQPVV